MAVLAHKQAVSATRFRLGSSFASFARSQSIQSAREHIAHAFA
jgi:hypothetical protein